MKKLITLTMILCCFFYLVSCKSNKQNNEFVEDTGNADDQILEPPFTPDGYIYTAEQLAKLAPNGNYTLANDIDLGNQEWAPIYYDDVEYTTFGFTGVLDGNGYSIKNMVTSPSEYTGLFAVNSGTIINLGIENATVKTSAASGDMQLSGLIAGRNYGTIKNCFAKGAINNFSPERVFNRTGGLIGQNDGSVINCYADVSISSRSVYSNESGGLVGHNSGLVVNSYSLGDITAFSEDTIITGGFIGNNTGNVFNCYSTSNVNAKAEVEELGTFSSAYVGGFVGFADGITRNSFCTGVCDIESNIVYSIDEVCGNGKSHTNGCYFIDDETELSNVKNEEWMLENLWITEKGVWTWDNGGLPTLDLDFIRSSSIEISSEADLRALQTKILTLNYVLKNDIRLTEKFSSIITFVGTFDGNGKTIYDLHNKRLGSGLIVFNGGEIKDITVKNMKISLLDVNNVYYSYAGLIGYNYGTISNCSVDAEFYTDNNVDCTLVGYIGAIAAYNTGTLTFNKADVTVSANLRYATAIGGITAVTHHGYISNCYSSGDIIATYTAGECSVEIGGIVGICDNTDIINCYSRTNIDLNLFAEDVNACLGGIAATIYFCDIKHSITTGNIICEITGNGERVTAGVITGTEVREDLLAHNEYITNCYSGENQLISANTVMIIRHQGYIIESDDLLDKEFLKKSLKWSDDFISLFLDN